MLLSYVCLYLLAKLDSTSSLFKEHIDLQKVAEIMFQNEKYNVLKPTIHIVKDHFAEFIQKRHNVDNSERMFLDRNGLRHIWKGLQLPQLRSFRKAVISQKDINDKNKIETINHNTTISDSEVEKGPVSKDSRRTEIKTTFFCPFFGLVRMNTHVEKFDLAENKTRR